MPSENGMNVGLWPINSDENECLKGVQGWEVDESVWFMNVGLGIYVTKYSEMEKPCDWAL